MYKLRDWVNIDKIDWNWLSMNPNAIHLLEKNVDKIYWYYLSSNPNAIHLLEKNVDKIDWNMLSCNPNAIHLLEKNIDKINWSGLSENPSIFELDYEALESRCNIFKEELMKKALHPSIIIRYLNHPDFKDKDLEYILDYCI